MSLEDDLSAESIRLETALKKAIRSKRVPKDHCSILEAAALEVAELEFAEAFAGGHSLLWTSFLDTLWRHLPAPEED